MTDPPLSEAPPRPRVYITGMGVASPMGGTLHDHVESLREGKNHFREVPCFDTSRMRTQTAGVANVDESHDGKLSAAEWNRMDRGAKLLYQATRDAIKSAGEVSFSDNCLFSVGTSAGAMPVGEAFFKNVETGSNRNFLQFQRSERYQAQRSLRTVQRALDLSLSSLLITNACTSGANALGHAFQEIRSGREHRCLAAGYDGLSELVFGGFNSLKALCESGIPRPFDENRDGLAIGEGAACFVVESESSMLARGAKPLVEVCGYGIATDLHHLTQPDPEGGAALASMTLACRQAEIEPRDIQYINSHGTGTPLNDVAEANAIKRWLPDKHSRNSLCVSSTKSAMGHLLGGAGAVESAICVIALTQGIVPASLNIDTVDPVCDFDLVRTPREKSLSKVLTNSFGFGGCNASLVLSAP